MILLKIIIKLESVTQVQRSTMCNEVQHKIVISDVYKSEAEDFVEKEAAF